MQPNTNTICESYRKKNKTWMSDTKRNQPRIKHRMESVAKVLCAYPAELSEVTAYLHSGL